MDRCKWTLPRHAHLLKSVPRDRLQIEPLNNIIITLIDIESVMKSIHTGKWHLQLQVNHMP